MNEIATTNNTHATTETKPKQATIIDVDCHIFGLKSILTLSLDSLQFR